MRRPSNEDVIQAIAASTGNGGGDIEGPLADEYGTSKVQANEWVRQGMRDIGDDIPEDLAFNDNYLRDVKLSATLYGYHPQSGWRQVAKLVNLTWNHGTNAKKLARDGARRYCDQRGIVWDTEKGETHRVKQPMLKERLIIIKDTYLSSDG